MGSAVHALRPVLRGCPSWDFSHMNTQRVQSTVASYFRRLKMSVSDLVSPFFAGWVPQATGAHSWRASLRKKLPSKNTGSNSRKTASTGGSVNDGGQTVMDRLIANGLKSQNVSYDVLHADATAKLRRMIAAEEKTE